MYSLILLSVLNFGPLILSINAAGASASETTSGENTELTILSVLVVIEVYTRACE